MFISLEYSLLGHTVTFASNCFLPEAGPRQIYIQKIIDWPLCLNLLTALFTKLYALFFNCSDKHHELY